MIQLAFMSTIGFIGAIIGLFEFFWGIQQEHAVGLILFMAGISFLAAGLAGQAILKDLKQRP